MTDDTVKLMPMQIEHAARIVREDRETVVGMAQLLGVHRSTLYRTL